MSNRFDLVLVSVLAVAAAGCASATQDAAAKPSNGRPYDLRRVGEYFETKAGPCVLIRVQDEYRLIRCVETGPIAGCYEDIFSLNLNDVEWNEWVNVQPAPGLTLAFLSPDEFVVRFDESAGAVQIPAQ